MKKPLRAGERVDLHVGNKTWTPFIVETIAGDKCTLARQDDRSVRAPGLPLKLVTALRDAQLPMAA